MKTKIALLLISSVLLLSSCEIFDPIFNPSKSDCLLQKTSWSIPNDPAHEETLFTYDASENLTEVVKKSYDLEPDPYVERWTMTYSNNKLEKITHYTKFYADPEEKADEYVFHYNGDQPDSVAIFTAPSFNQAGYALLQYAGGKLSKVEDYNPDPAGSGYRLYYTRDLDWTGDNVTKITTTNLTGSVSSSDFEYDDKKTPLSHLGLAMTNFGSLAMLSSNNNVKKTYTGSDGTPHVFDRTYTYSAGGYPESLTLTDGVQTTYEYTCK